MVVGVEVHAGPYDEGDHDDGVVHDREDATDREIPAEPERAVNPDQDEGGEHEPEGLAGEGRRESGADEVGTDDRDVFISPFLSQYPVKAQAQVLARLGIGSVVL